MRSTLALYALLASLTSSHAAQSSGCGSTLPTGLSSNETSNLTFTTSDGVERNYLLYLPQSYDTNTAAGLIWSYHGRGKDAAHQQKISKFSDSSVNSDHVVVYPQGLTGDGGKATKHRRQSNDDDDEEDEGEDEGDDESDDARSGSGKGSSKRDKRVWQGDPDASTDDVKFTLELLDNLSKTFCVEEDRVYASGMSNGGGFAANVLACNPDATKKFAAFASASGAYYQNDNKGKCKADDVKIKCNNGAKVALITIAGGKDKTIPYEGGARRKSCLPSGPHFMTSWAERDGLSSTNDTSTVDNSDVEHYSFGEGDSAGMMQSYFIPEMGHSWPKGNKKTVISASKVFMDFFADWNLTRREAAASSLPNTTSAASSFRTGSWTGILPREVSTLVVATVACMTLL